MMLTKEQDAMIAEFRRELKTGDLIIYCETDRLHGLLAIIDAQAADIEYLQTIRKRLRDALVEHRTQAAQDRRRRRQRNATTAAARVVLHAITQPPLDTRAEQEGAG